MKNIIHIVKNTALRSLVFLVIINLAFTVLLLNNALMVRAANYGQGGDDDTTYGQPPPPTNPSDCTDDQICPPIAARSFSDFIESIAKAITLVGIPIAAVFIIYSGLLFVTARGNESKISEAKTAFTWAMIGTAVLLGARVIASAISTTVKNF